MNDKFNNVSLKNVKGYINGSSITCPKLEITSTKEVIEFNTEEECEDYIQNNNLKEEDYVYKFSIIYFHRKYSKSN